MKSKNYNAESYWDEKARRSGQDFRKAVGVGDPLRDRVIDRIQQRLMRLAFRQIAKETGLKGKAVLDFGCGSGRWVELLQSKGLRYSGVDISGKMVAMAAGRYPDLDFRKLENLSIPYPDNHFDLLMSIAVIHHNDYGDQQRLLDEILRVLKPGGYLLLFEGLGRRSAGGTVHYYRPGDDWRQFLAENGFGLRWSATTRYWTLQVVYDTLASKLFGGLIKKFSLMNRFHNSLKRGFTWLDAYVDPWLISRLPERMQGRLMLLMRKQ